MGETRTADTGVREALEKAARYARDEILGQVKCNPNPYWRNIDTQFYWRQVAGVLDAALSRTSAEPCDQCGDTGWREPDGRTLLACCKCNPKQQSIRRPRTNAEPPSTDAVVGELPEYTKDALSRAREHFMRLYLEKMDKDQGELAKLYESTIDGIDEIAVALGWRVPPDSKLYQHPAPTAPTSPDAPCECGHPASKHLPYYWPEEGVQCRAGGVTEEDVGWQCSCKEFRPTSPDASGGEDAVVLYACRCGWCGAYEGTVDPAEPCATDENGYIGPHQFGRFEKWTPDSAVPTPDGRENTPAPYYTMEEDDG